MKFAPLALSAGILASGASAQFASRIHTSPANFDDPAFAARYEKAIANCTYRPLGPNSVRAILSASDPVTVDFERSGVALSSVQNSIKDCMESRREDSSVQLGFKYSRLRAMLAEEDYLATHETALALPENAAEGSNRVYVSEGEALTSAQGLGNFADCVVHRDAAGADHLLRTEPGSTEEAGAARALSPVLAGCLIEGQTIEFTPASIRAMAADGLWSRAVYGSQQSN